MLTQNNMDARMSALSSTVSDLLVGLKCSDAPEVERVARKLKDRAEEYGLSLVSLTAHQIEKTSAAGDLDAAHQLVAELKEQLQQAPLLMRQTAGAL